MGAHIRAAQEEEQAAKVDAARAIESAKRRIAWAKWVFIGTAMVGLIAGVGEIFDPNRTNDPRAPSTGMLILVVPISAVLSGYFFWGMYWGVPAVWRWLRSLGDKVGGAWEFFASPLALLIFMGCFFYVWLVAAAMYGVLGGGLNEYQKYKKLAESGA